MVVMDIQARLTISLFTLDCKKQKQSDCQTTHIEP